MPVLSVVTVTKDLIDGGRAEAFEKGFAALHGQNGVEIEHVIQDGGSTDGTVAFMEGLAQSRPNVSIQSAPDDGIYHAMNIGAARSTGAYLLFYNSDDILIGNSALGEAVSAMAGTGANYLYGQIVVERSDGTLRLWKQMSPDNALHMVPFAHGALIVDRALFEELGGFSQEYRVYSDYEFMLRMIASGARGRAFRKPMLRFAAGGVSNVWEGRSEEFVVVWRRFVQDYVDLSGYQSEEIASWLESKIVPRDVLDAMEASMPPSLARAVRVSRRTALRRRIKRRIFGTNK